MASEPVRLVVWDLDDTFWDGSISEGGITNYIWAHHKIVIELAHRGIMSSICSKNDSSIVENILREYSLWDYFIFPSIDWSPKGHRLKLLVEAVGLRPPAILFIDDNPSNRAEAILVLPEMQVCDEHCIGSLLLNPLLKGQSDPELSRLKQYKLLEQRQNQRRQFSGDNQEFLRSSGIRIWFEHDVEAHIGRAVELINRTNQLNFTKQRLSEDPVQAQEELLCQIRPFGRQSALIGVQDRYGNYGYCGFFLRHVGQGSGAGRLAHFCFSCRILGMFVEKWVYDRLGKPNIQIVQNVLTDLNESYDVDWISLEVDFNSKPIGFNYFPQIYMRGGCEIDSIAHYFTPYTSSNCREGSLTRGSLFVRKDCSCNIHIPGTSALDESFLQLATACGFTLGDFVSGLFKPAAPGSLFIYSNWGDTQIAYRHKASGRLLVPGLLGTSGDVTQMTLEDLKDITIQRKNFGKEQEAFLQAADALKQLTECVGPLGEADVKANLHSIFSSIPKGCKIICLALDEYWKNKGESPNPLPAAIACNQWLHDVSAEFGVKVFHISDYIQKESEREFGHFDRIVYYRLATEIIKWATS